MPIAITLLLLLIGAAAVGFYMAWTIGANDVANAMGTAVGSGTLTLKKAIVIAGVFEFLGAVLVGAHVTTTLKAGIINPTYFIGVGKEELLMYGMLAALLGAAIWVTIATYFALPVSTSHAIVGSLVGFGLSAVLLGIIEISAMGLGKVGEIILSWLLSPILGIILAFIIFGLLRKSVLYAEDPIKSARKIIPIVIAAVFGIVAFSILSEGMRNINLKLSLIETVISSTFIGIIAGFVSYYILMRFKPKETVSKINQAEKLFGYLLILTCCYIAFAHGANNVGNAVGPLTAIISIGVAKGTIGLGTTIPFWILILGGLGLFAGIATWGYRVIETIGKRITEITPTSGFTVTFSAATITLLCTQLGYPASVSHIVVGAVIGVGLAGGIRALDTKVIGKIIISWIITLPAAAALSATLYLGFIALV